MANGEHVNRDWLVYSQKLDAAVCFCCCIFGSNTVDLGIGSSKGFRNWSHLTQTVKVHEHSASHLQNYMQWKALAKNIAEQNTIENQLFKQIEQEKERLRQVFKRLIAFILYLARQNIAFFGSSTKLHDTTGQNGNFQQLIFNS